jgi:hypothetical protein
MVWVDLSHFSHFSLDEFRSLGERGIRKGERRWEDKRNFKSLLSRARNPTIA